MNKIHFTRLLLVLLVLTFTLIACRNEEEPEPVPTKVPTAVPLDTTDADTTNIDSDAVAAPKPTATSEPIAAVDPVDMDWPPQLVYASPMPGEETPINGAITLRFDQPMDQDSVEDAFTITEADNTVNVDGEFTWDEPDTLIFTPKINLKRQHNYKVRVADTAVAANGLNLSQSVELDVQTVGYLEVSQVIPEDGADGVQTDGAITVMFNRPVVPLVATGEQAGLPQPLTFNPPAQGVGQWLSTSVYRFQPEPPLDGATSYQVTVNAGLEDVTGGVLADDFSWNFSSISPGIVSINPPNESVDVIPTEVITVTFNMPMDQASTEAATLFAGVGQGTASVTYHWSDDGRNLSLKPDQPLALETVYQVVVGSSARAASGQASLGSETVNTFTTVPYPAIVFTNPQNGTVADEWQYGVNIHFASPMDLATFEDRIIIEPEPGFVSSYWNDYDNSLSLSFPLERKAEYQVTVPGDAADPYGNTLSSDYTFRFTTPDHPPIASFNLPQGVSQLSTSFTTEVGIIHHNVSKLEVELYDVGLPLYLLNDNYSLYDYQPTSGLIGSWEITQDALGGEAGLFNLALAGDGGTLPTGVYYATVDAPELGDDARYWQNQHNMLVVADTNIVIKEFFDEIHVWVTDIATGKPAPGRNLELYDVRGVPTGTAVSDANGFASFTNPPVDYLEGVTVVSNQPGEAGFGVASSQWDGGARPWQMGINNTNSDEAPRLHLPLHRPPHLPAWRYGLF